MEDKIGIADEIHIIANDIHLLVLTNFAGKIHSSLTKAMNSMDCLDYWL